MYLKEAESKYHPNTIYKVLKELILFHIVHFKERKATQNRENV